MQFPTVNQTLHQQQHQHQQQAGPHSLPPAPTFASLGGAGLPYMGNLGSLAQGHQPPNLSSAQGLSAAIPPSAYLMQQSHQFQQQQQQHQHHQQHQHQHQHQQQNQPAAPQQEKKSSKKEDTNFGLVLPLHKVKRLIKSESSVKAVSGEASFAIARAAKASLGQLQELLLEQLLERAYSKMASSNRGSIEYDDIGSPRDGLRPCNSAPNTAAQYRDEAVQIFVAGAISRATNTSMQAGVSKESSDMVPETQTLNELMERVKRQDAAAKQHTRPVAKGQAAEQAA